MVINKVEIAKFRGYRDATLELGTHITLIAGRNGTQKSTLLGLLTQPFTITGSQNPLKGESPLCGGSFKSSFAESFKLSDNFDKPGEHEWTVYVKKESLPYTVSSMYRDKKKGKIRFWKKGDRRQGTGYIQRPVIYLSLKRLAPIGEDKGLKATNTVVLTEDEKIWFGNAYNKILISRDDIKSYDYLKSTHKNTMGVTSELYDWQSNSAGQDNIGKILLAILSFKRLKEKYKLDYLGGILAIDEIDASLYPASQVKLLEFLAKCSSKFKIQIIATTHSLPAIKQICNRRTEPQQALQFKLAFLEKKDNQIQVNSDASYDYILNKLNAEIGTEKVMDKVRVFTEDSECSDFAKALIKRKYPHVDFMSKVSLGCSQLIALSRSKVPNFTAPHSIIILDGDVRRDKKLLKQLTKNCIVLPTDNSPEQELANFLNNLSDYDPFWTSKVSSYDKEVCFRDYSLNEIINSRDIAKNWYNAQKVMNVWGAESRSLYNRWMEEVENKPSIVKFLDDFEKLYYPYLESL